MFLVLCLLDFGQTAWARNLTVYKIIRKSAALEICIFLIVSKSNYDSVLLTLKIILTRAKR